MALPNQGSCPMAIIEDSADLDSLQKKMHLALVLTPLDPKGVLPDHKELFGCIRGALGDSYLPSHIATYAPDFILHFDSVHIRDAVKNLGMLRTKTANLSISYWSPFYRNHTIPWDTKVLITVSCIPSFCCHADILPPLLSAYCDIRKSSFNKRNGTCQIEAFCASVTAIPTSGSIAYCERFPSGTVLRTYPVVMMACEAQIPFEDIINDPRFIAFCNEYPQYYWKMLLTAFEFGVDPDVHFEHYQEIEYAEDVLEGRIKPFDDGTSSEDSMDYDGYSHRMWDQYSPSDDLSDREPASWKGRNI